MCTSGSFHILTGFPLLSFLVNLDYRQQPPAQGNPAVPPSQTPTANVSAQVLLVERLFPVAHHGQISVSPSS